MPTRNFLAFDLGAESGRAVLGTLESERLTLAERHRFANPTSRMLGHLHWNASAQWEELKAGLRKGAAGTKLDGIGVDTWGLDFGLLDRDGQFIGEPFHYRDGRTDGMLERTFAKVSREKIFEATGVQFMPFNTLFQIMAMVESQSSVLEQAQTLLFMPDLFNYLFTGVKSCEFSIASTSQMLDPRTGTWARGMLEQLGIPTRILQRIVPSGTALGGLCEEVRAECGVGEIPVIAPGTHDTASAVAAVPASGEDWCYISSGTWSLLGVEIDKPVINDKSLKYNYTNEGGVGGTIRFLKNIMGLWLVQECRRHWLKEGREYNYAELTKMAADSPGLVSLIDPDHAPFGAPDQMPQKIAEYCRKTGQKVPENPGQFVRACLDSLALTYRYRLEGLEEVLGRKIKVIHIVGGGVQNELLSQMTADACGRTVIAGPVEATAAGNILVQAMAIGEIKTLAEARAIVRNSFEVKKYEPRGGKQWEEAYGRFSALAGA
jgi:rhamnulokinase